MSKNALILHSKLHNANNQTYYCIHPLCLQTNFNTEVQLAEHYKFYHQLSDSIAEDMVKRQLTNENGKDDDIAAKLSEIAEPPRLTALDPVPPNDASLSIKTNQIERYAFWEMERFSCLSVLHRPHKNQEVDHVKFAKWRRKIIGGI